MRKIYKDVTNKIDETKLDPDPQVAAQQDGPMLDQISPTMCMAKWLWTSIHLTNGTTNSCFLPPIHKIDPENLVIAYEPIWAIGTGLTASPEQAQEIHKYIRNLLSERYGNKISDNTSIIYGGSVKPNSARDIFEKQDVDGGLIGGASLSPQDFIDIVRSI